MITQKSTVAEARRSLRKQQKTGAKCPCCERFSKTYKRSITSAMAVALILIKKHFDNDKKKRKWLHVEDYLKTLNIPSSIRGDFSKLCHWGLLSKLDGNRHDMNKRTGYYTLTSAGIAFVQRKRKVSLYITFRNNKPIYRSKILIDIREALDNKFNYKHLMAGIVVKAKPTIVKL